MAEIDTSGMVAAGWWAGSPPQQRERLIASRALVLPDGTWWVYGAAARWYRWHPADGQWHLCPPPQVPATRMAAQPLRPGMQGPPIPPHLIPDGPDFGYDPPAPLAFVGHDISAEITARVGSTVESAAALPPMEYPHWWGLFSSTTPSPVAVAWGVALWCAHAPVFDSRLDDRLLGLWSPYRARPLPEVDGPRWLTPPPLEALVGLYSERLRSGRVDAAVVLLRTMWAVASALREDPRFNIRAEALLAILGGTLDNPTVDYGALPYGDQALVQQWLTRCPPHLAAALRIESAPGEHFRHTWYDLALAITPLLGNAADPAYVEPRFVAAALIAADLAVVRQDVGSAITAWFDPEVRYAAQGALAQGNHPLRQFWPADSRLSDVLHRGVEAAGGPALDRWLATMYAADLAWCRVGGGMPARPRGFPVPTALVAEILGPNRSRGASTGDAAAPGARQQPSAPVQPGAPPGVQSGAQQPGAQQPSAQPPPWQAGGVGSGQPASPGAAGVPVSGYPGAPAPGSAQQPGSVGPPTPSNPPQPAVPPPASAGPPPAGYEYGAPPYPPQWAQPPQAPQPPSGPGDTPEQYAHAAAAPAPDWAPPGPGTPPGMPGMPPEASVGPPAGGSAEAPAGPPPGPPRTRVLPDGLDEFADSDDLESADPLAAPQATRVMDDDAGKAPEVPPALGTRVLPDDVDLDAPMPDQPVGTIAPPPTENKGPAVVERYGIRFVSGEDDAEALFDGLGQGTRERTAPDQTRVDTGKIAPCLLLVGRPHTGQYRLARLVARTLAERGFGDGSVRLAHGAELRGATVDEIAARLDAAGQTLLLERFDILFSGAAEPAQVAAAVRDLRRGRGGTTSLLATCDPDAYQRLAGDYPELTAEFQLFRLPELADVDSRMALLHVLADERRVTISAPALELVTADLERLSGPGDMVNARLVEAYLERACANYYNRVGTARDRLVLDQADFAGLAEEIEPALREPGDVEGYVSRLATMIGLDEVKQTVGGLVAEARLAADRTAQGLPPGNPSRHLIFMGSSGTGKTTVAGLLGGIYAALGLLDSGHVVACRPTHLIGRDRGDTAAKVSLHVDQAMGGVLLIQGADRLVRDPGAADELLRFMEERRDKFMVICAGPVDELNEFLLTNPGFRAEFGAIIEFRDLTDRELVQMFKQFAERDLYMLDEELRVELMARLGRMREDPAFANAHTVRQMFDETVARQAARLASSQVNAATAARLSVHDLPESALEQMLGDFRETPEP